jgi:hypothetical protein
MGIQSQLPQKNRLAFFRLTVCLCESANSLNDGEGCVARRERERTRSRASPRARSREPGVAVLRLREGASAVASPPPRVSSRGNRPDPSPDPRCPCPTTCCCAALISALARAGARRRRRVAAAMRLPASPRGSRRAWRRARSRGRRPRPRAGATRADGCVPARWLDGLGARSRDFSRRVAAESGSRRHSFLFLSRAGAARVRTSKRFFLHL